MNNRPLPIKKTKSRGLSYDSNFFIAKDESEVFPFCKYFNYKNTVLSKKNLPLHIKEHNFVKRVLNINVASIQK